MTFEVGVAHKRHPHLLADLAELVLAARYDDADEVSQSRLEQLLKEMPEAAEEVDFANEESAMHAVDQHESTDRHVEDCWAQLEYRLAVFGEFYPFQLQGPRLVWKEGDRTNRQRAYIFLLICSRLRSFRVAGFPQRAAKVFAQVSKLALQTLSAPAAVIRIFDANSEDRQNHYGTNLRAAMKTLAVELGAHHVAEDEIGKLEASGDRGLDLVSVFSFNDVAKGTLAIFGQCGAQETEWPSKTLEAHPLRFDGLFVCLNPPANLMFIPISFRDSTGGWVAGYKVSGCLLIDRVRILKLLEQRWDVAEIEVQNRCQPVLQEVMA